MEKKKLLENQFLNQTLPVWLQCQKVIHLTMRLLEQRSSFLKKKKHYNTIKSKLGNLKYKSEQCGEIPILVAF